MPAYRFCLLMALACPSSTLAQTTGGYTPEECPPCASWNEPTDPVRIFGSTYWVGTRRLGAILIASDSGHVLIDGALPESAPLIEANIEALGFDMDDVRLILNTHAHYDHAGGVAALQRSSGARVAALGPSAETMEAGRPTPADPQTRSALTYPSVPSVDRISDGDTLAVGPTRLTAHRTAGHTPGGTSWSWRDCEGDRCLELVYADSQTPVSDDGFRFSDGPYSSAVDDFQTGQETLRSLDLRHPHHTPPGCVQVLGTLERRRAGGPDRL